MRSISALIPVSPGPNGIGKSNVFDAIHFLSLLADLSILEAALQVRSRTGSTARLDDLFFRSDAVRHDKFKIAAEMLVDQRVIDDFGRPDQATSTFLRYEIEIGRRTGAASADGLTSDLELRSESLQLIRQGDAGKRLRFPHSKSRFRDSAVRNRRFAKTGYISTEWSDSGTPEIIVHQGRWCKRSRAACTGTYRTQNDRKHYQHDSDSDHPGRPPRNAEVEIACP